MTFDRSVLKAAKRIVVKVGTSTITYANGKRNFEQIDRLARELADLQNQGKEMILVTSGAVAVGVDRLGLSEKPKTIPGKQAAAAVGQGILMHTYEKLFAEYGQVVAQVLLTKTESLDRHRYTNSRNTFMELLRNRVIPIVNENDVVALDELKIGDNDNMSALVAGIVDADLVVILSDVDGLYTANPQTDPTARLVSIVSDITPEVEASAGGVGSSLGTGGMFTKIQAAKAATSSGIHLAIARGDEKYAIARILQGEDIAPSLFPKKTVCSSVNVGWRLEPASWVRSLSTTAALKLCAKPVAAASCPQVSQQWKASLKPVIQSASSTCPGTSWPAV